MALNPSIRDWKDKTVWIVGASSGIGMALAQALAAAGARVIASARREEALRSITPAPWKCLVCDVRSAQSIDTAISIMRNSSAVPDVVFWVAGVYHPMDSSALNLDQVRETFEINTIAGYDGLQKILNLWRDADKTSQSVRHWVWVSSVAGYRGLPQAAAYGASKAALTYLAEVNYLELKAKNIAVSVVCPGFVETRLTQKNDFKMPAIITPEEAAKATLHGLAKGEFEIHYPKRFTRWLKLLRLLPYGLYFKIVGKAVPRTH